MSQEQESQSSEEFDEQSADSVFDYLYYDEERISSFLSQFDKSGQLTSIVQREAANESEQTAVTAKARMGLPSVITGQAGTKTETGSGTRQESQRAYDPTWANASLFLDYLSEHNLIHRDISEAPIGRFVLCSGSLSIVDLQLMERIWNLSWVRELVQAGADNTSNRQERRARAKQRGSPGNPEPVKMMIDLLSILPHTIQAKLFGKHNVWGILNERGMSISANAIPLEYGTEMLGEWNLLGILDTRSSDMPTFDAESNDGSGGELVATTMAALSPLARQLLGRPVGHYGVTPLLIFRDVMT